MTILHIRIVEVHGGSKVTALLVNVEVFSSCWLAIPQGRILCMVLVESLLWTVFSLRILQKFVACGQEGVFGEIQGFWQPDPPAVRVREGGCQSNSS